MKRIAKKRGQPPPHPVAPHPVDEIAQSAADGARIATHLALMVLDGLVAKLGYELRPKGSVVVDRRPVRAVAKPKPKAKKAKAKPGVA